MSVKDMLCKVWARYAFTPHQNVDINKVVEQVEAMVVARDTFESFKGMSRFDCIEKVLYRSSTC
jgi:hypothetical protein